MKADYMKSTEVRNWNAETDATGIPPQWSSESANIRLRV